MQYHPKLKIAAEEIKEILKKHDIAAFVVLHAPGFSEYILEVSPSYSCAKIGHDNIRIKAAASDYNGGATERNEKIRDTVNMLNHLSETGSRIIMQLIGISEHLDKVTGAEHSKGSGSSHTQQNN